MVIEGLLGSQYNVSDVGFLGASGPIIKVRLSCPGRRNRGLYKTKPDMTPQRYIPVNTR